MCIQRRNYIKVRYPVDKFGSSSSSLSNSSGSKQSFTKPNNSSAVDRELRELQDHVKHLMNKKKYSC